VWQFFVTSFAAKKVSKKIVSDETLLYKSAHQLKVVFFSG
jgi:hypothetical protein